MSALEMVGIGGAAGAGVLVAGWLLKLLIVHWLNKAFAAEKRVMRHQNEKQLATYKAELERASLEHRVRFSRLHERRAERAIEMYSALSQVSMSMNRLERELKRLCDADMDRSFESVANERMNYTFKKLRDAGVTCENMMGEGDILFGPIISKKIRNLHRMYIAPMMAEEFLNSDPTTREFINHVTRVRDETNEDMRQLKLDLQEEFRDLWDVS